jgi:hypothetical protein
VFFPVDDPFYGECFEILIVVWSDLIPSRRFFIIVCKTPCIFLIKVFDILPTRSKALWMFILRGERKKLQQAFKLTIRPLLEKGKPIVRWGRKATDQEVS